MYTNKRKSRSTTFTKCSKSMYIIHIIDGFYTSHTSPSLLTTVHVMTFSVTLVFWIDESFLHLHYYYYGLKKKLGIGFCLKTKGYDRERLLRYLPDQG